MSEYRDFAVDTAVTIAQEEAQALQDAMLDDVVKLSQSWAVQLRDRIQQRMDDLGIPQVLQIEIEWNPDPPEIRMIGATYVGGASDEEP